MDERDTLLANREKLATLGDKVCNEHVLGFKKGIAQCHYIFKVPLDHPSYDIMKTVVDGQLIDVPLPATIKALAP